MILQLFCEIEQEDPYFLLKMWIQLLRVEMSCIYEGYWMYGFGVLLSWNCSFYLFTPSFNIPKSLLTLAIIKLNSLFENLQKERQNHEDRNASLFSSKGA